MEVYPNRDSLEYISIYGIPEVKTMCRGTFRHKNWCEALDLLKALKLTTYDELDLKGKTYAGVTASLNGFDENSLCQEIKTKFNIDDDDIGLQAIEWLGVLSSNQVHIEKGTPFDLVSDLMVDKMMLDKTERDMVIMQHVFRIVKATGKKETIVARLLDYGNNEYTSIARTVALPAANGVKLILEEKIIDKGVLIPIKKAIYAPILKELKILGISMNEQVEEVNLELY